MCLASLALVALWALSAVAIASGHSKPTVTVVSANAAGKDTLKVTVPVRKGRGCAGKVNLSAGEVRAKANLAAHKTPCQALLHLRLPRRDFRKVVAFKLHVAGARGVSNFALTVHLRLSPPPKKVPAGPSQDGTYRWVLDEGKEGKGSPWSEGEMIVKGGKLTAIGLYTASAVTVECEEGPEKITLDYNPIGPLISGGLGNGKFSAVYMTHAYKVEFSGTLKYNPATQKPYGEMNFSMVGKSEGFTCSRQAHGTNLVYTP